MYMEKRARGEGACACARVLVRKWPTAGWWWVGGWPVAQGGGGEGEMVRIEREGRR